MRVRDGDDPSMVMLVRADGGSLAVPRLLWEAAQVFAKKAGWRPAGAAAEEPAAYVAGARIGERDARSLAAALERVVNGSVEGCADLDLAELAPLVALVNFLRGGGFELRA